MIIFRDGTKDTKRGKFQVTGCLNVIMLSQDTSWVHTFWQFKIWFCEITKKLSISATCYKRPHVDIFICIYRNEERKKSGHKKIYPVLILFKENLSFKDCYLRFKDWFHALHLSFSSDSLLWDLQGTISSRCLPQSVKSKSWCINFTFIWTTLWF